MNQNVLALAAFAIAAAIAFAPVEGDAQAERVSIADSSRGLAAR